MQQQQMQQPVADGALEPAATSDLAEGWQSAVDPSSGNTYYIETATMKTTWDKPTQQQQMQAQQQTQAQQQMQQMQQLQLQLQQQTQQVQPQQQPQLRHGTSHRAW
jgi:hypothetical protein